MQHRFSIQDIVHHINVAASSQRNFADLARSDERLATQFRRQADQAHEIMNAFDALDNTSGARRVFLDGDQLVVEVA